MLNLSESYLFGDATYHVNQRRESKLRRPVEMPDERDLKKLRHFTLERIEQLVEDNFEFCDIHKYTELRDLLVCRLTLYNMHRGEANQPDC